MIRELHVWMLPSMIPPAALRDGAAVIIDLLRASTTIVRALAAGAERIIPSLEPDLAMLQRDAMIAQGLSRDSIMLGGERAGLRIAGFDLANTPAEYTPTRVSGRTIIFTTTNGTRALYAAREAEASPIIMGCFNNLVAVNSALLAQPTIHLVCAGTQGQVSIEDVICAGAMVASITASAPHTRLDDQARIALAAWEAAARTGLESALRASRGGQNLIDIGLDHDITDCAGIDTHPVVPRLMNDGSLRVREQT